VTEASPDPQARPAGPTTDPVVLAVDLGTGGPKVALISLGGEIVGSVYRRVEPKVAADGTAVQNPDVWWRPGPTPTPPPHWWRWPSPASGAPPCRSTLTATLSATACCGWTPAVPSWPPRRWAVACRSRASAPPRWPPGSGGPAERPAPKATTRWATASSSRPTRGTCTSEPTPSSSRSTTSTPASPDGWRRPARRWPCRG